MVNIVKDPSDFVLINGIVRTKSFGYVVDYKHQSNLTKLLLSLHSWPGDVSVRRFFIVRFLLPVQKRSYILLHQSVLLRSGRGQTHASPCGNILNTFLNK